MSRGGKRAKGECKLTANQIEWACDKLIDGYSKHEVAVALNIKPSYLYNLLHDMGFKVLRPPLKAPTE